VEKFYKVRCPQCREWARRETDVSDTFLDSAWYFLRYPSAGDAKNAWDSAITKKWLPVNMYIGGAEHSVLHLLYSRFVTTAFHDFGLLSFEEPFSVFRAHGLITKDGAKMSKSKGNVVSPDEYFKTYGADTTRMYLAFLAPLPEGGDFRDEGIAGITRFLDRVWRFGSKKTWALAQDDSIKKVLYKTIKKITEDIENLHYNTAISALMILLRAFEERGRAVTKKDFETFIKLLAPFAPFISEELYQAFQKVSRVKGKSAYESVHQSAWPTYDEKFLAEETYMLVVQINGKVRDQFLVPSGITQNEAETLTKKREKITNLIKGKAIEKVIFVPKRLINLVV
jgi:leucyl-tRNA synthetase